MVYHTFTAGEVLTASTVMNDLMNQSVIVCTSGTRPASPVAGMVIYETDTTNFNVWSGSAWVTFARTPAIMPATATGSIVVRQEDATHVTTTVPATTGTTTFTVVGTALGISNPGYLVVMHVTGRSTSGGAFASATFNIHVEREAGSATGTAYVVGSASNGGGSTWGAGAGTWQVSISAVAADGSTVTVQIANTGATTMEYRAEYICTALS